MRIIVIGAGKVGYTLAEHLTSEEHDVTVIDKSSDVIDRCSGSLDVICIKGNGANAKVLLEAGVDKANIVIASTESDESNMLSCLIAKRLGAHSLRLCRRARAKARYPFGGAPIMGT